jgi:hypothetical protein
LPRAGHPFVCESTRLSHLWTRRAVGRIPPQRGRTTVRSPLHVIVSSAGPVRYGPSAPVDRLAARTAPALAGSRPIILRPRALAALAGAVAAVGRRARRRKCGCAGRQGEGTRKHETRELSLHSVTPFLHRALCPVPRHEPQPERQKSPDNLVQGCPTPLVTRVSTHPSTTNGSVRRDSPAHGPHAYAERRRSKNDR